jgi:hypothetical protein
VDLASPGAMFNAGALILGIVWLQVSDLPSSARFLLRVAVASAAVSFVFVALVLFAPRTLPSMVLVLMPSRLMNFNAMVFAALAIGLLAARPKLWTYAVLAGVLAGILFEYTLPSLGIASMVLFYEGLALWKMPPTPGLHAPGLQEPGLQNKTRPTYVGGALRAVALAVCLVAAYHTMRMSRPQAEMFRDRTNDPFFAAVASEREGLLATAGSYHLVQLYTRRPVLIDGGGLDGLVYAPEGAPMAERILRDVYGLDYFNPPPGARSQGLIPHDLTRAAWESYSGDKWRAIRRTYQVTQVLTPGDWTLNLPVVAQDHRFRLYRTPE